jgi:hypothetical protein
MKSDLRKLVLQHLKEHGKKVVNGFLLSKNRSQATDLGAKRSANMLRSVGDKVFDAAHNVVEENVAVDKSAEAGNLAGNGGSHLGFVVLEELDEGGNKIPGNNFLIYGLGNL